jgi:hypothetical protein
MLWPEDEPWPFCPGGHAFEQDGPEPLPLIPVVQIYLREITEYPTFDWLPEEAAAAAERLEAVLGEDWKYTYDILAVAQGIKVGGWPGAATFWGPAGPGYFRCKCGAALDALAQFDIEWDEFNIWRPIEDAASTTSEERRRTQLAADLDIGRGYALQTYYCTADWTHPIARYMQ